MTPTNYGATVLMYFVGATRPCDVQNCTRTIEEVEDFCKSGGRGVEVVFYFLGIRFWTKISIFFSFDQNFDVSTDSPCGAALLLVSCNTPIESYNNNGIIRVAVKTIRIILSDVDL